MINFEEELKRFSPIPEVNQAEEAIYSNDLKDISDIVLQMTQDLRNTGSILDNAVVCAGKEKIRWQQQCDRCCAPMWCTGAEKWILFGMLSSVVDA